MIIFIFETFEEEIQKFKQLFDNNNLTWHDRISGTQLKFYTNF